MRAPNLGETELLIPLHEGMFEQPMWKTFLDRLRAVAGCEFASLVFRQSEGTNAVQLTSGMGTLAPRLMHLFNSTQPLGSARMRAGRLYTLEELIEAGGERERAFRDDILTPLDLVHLRSVRLSGEDGLDAWLLLASQNDLPVSVASLMTALLPHLQVALRVLARLERERARETMAAGVFSHMNFGWISIDRNCRIVDRDEQADQFMRRSGALRESSYGRLSPFSPAIDRQLTALAKEFAADPDARPRAINLSEDPWIDVLVSPVRLDALSADSKAVAVVYFRGEANSSADRCQQLVDVFNLTQSEARFAWSIAQGRSIAEAAEKHDLTIETARNYSKKIYSKTGARGQVDFMRRVFTSVIALAMH